MINMSDTVEDFVNWANGVMSERNLTQADIARAGFVKSAAVSMLFSMKGKSIGVDMCRAFAAATGIPLIVVFQKAGILPADAGTDELIAEIGQEAAEMTEDEKRSLLAFIRTTKNMRKGRKK